jgi:ketosteroid isomerase-like protein
MIGLATESDGRVSNKAQILADPKKRNDSSAAYEDVQVTAFGDTAIATGGFRAKGRTVRASPQALRRHVPRSDTWVKMPNGKWQAVAAHESLIKMK